MRRNRQIIRMVSLMLGLLRRDRLTVPALAEKHHVRKETIYRPELAAICFSATLTEHLTGTALHGALHEAIAKIRSHVPTASLPLLDAASTVFGSFKKGYKDYQPHAETLGRLVQAMMESRRCEVTYQSPHRSEPSHFAMDPYKLFEFGGSLYCFAYVSKHDQVITLAIDRIRMLRPTDETFAVSPNFSFEKLRDQAFGVVGGEPMTVRIQFRQDQVPYVKERIWHPTQTFEDLPNGDIVTTFRAGGEFEIVRWILGWGSAAKVLEPEHLRQLVHEELKEALRQMV